MSAITDATDILNTSLSNFTKALVHRTEEVLVSTDTSIAAGDTLTYDLDTVCTSLNIAILNLNLNTLRINTMIQIAADNWVDSDNFIDVELRPGNVVSFTNVNVTPHTVRILITVSRKAIV